MWEWFNGKKTVIGAVILWIATLIEAVFIQKYHVDAQWVLITVDLLKYVGGTLVPVGIGHKVIKKAQG